MEKQLSLSRVEARSLDEIAMKQYGILGIVLMENAGRGIFHDFLTYQPDGNIVLCCGQGNNGGDGFVLARYLDNACFSVHVLLFANPDTLKGDARINYEIMMNMGLSVTVISHENIEVIKPILSDADWIIDALFGTGLKGEVQTPFDEVIRYMNHAHKKVLAIDIPSGLDCDTGEALGVAVKATVTVSMVGVKQGFHCQEAKAYVGAVRVVDIGIPRKVLEAQIKT
ncbi:MAG: NAD(P)H-hydrate epimerase [Legionellaceae bacterium]|nr:NAD(P)H-hydrate epimerase [Legionellaceae bacterium]